MGEWEIQKERLKEDFWQWLDGYEHPKIVLLEDMDETSAWLNSQCHQQRGNGQPLAIRRLEQEVVSEKGRGDGIAFL